MLALTLLACSDPTPTPQEDVQPDIVLVLTSGLREDTDDHRATSLLLETTGVQPGLRFTAAYSQTVQPYISLGSMLTGRYPSAIPLCGVSRTPSRRSASTSRRRSRPWRRC